jgi:hypothetical protein
LKNFLNSFHIDFCLLKIWRIIHPIASKSGGVIGDVFKGRPFIIIVATFLTVLCGIDKNDSIVWSNRVSAVIVVLVIQELLWDVAYKQWWWLVCVFISISPSSVGLSQIIHWQCEVRGPCLPRSANEKYQPNPYKVHGLNDQFEFYCDELILDAIDPSVKYHLWNTKAGCSSHDPSKTS